MTSAIIRILWLIILFKKIRSITICFMNERMKKKLPEWLGNFFINQFLKPKIWSKIHQQTTNPASLESHVGSARVGFSLEENTKQYINYIVLKRTVRCSWTVQFFVMFDMFEVRFWAKMWCSESLMFGHSMFRVFEVQYFGVRSKTKRH